MQYTILLIHSIYVMKFFVVNIHVHIISSQTKVTHSVVAEGLATSLKSRTLRVKSLEIFAEIRKSYLK